MPLVELTRVLVEQVCALLSDVPDDEFIVLELVEDDPVEGFVTEMELLVC